MPRLLTEARQHTGRLQSKQGSSCRGQTLRKDELPGRQGGYSTDLRLPWQELASLGTETDQKLAGQTYVAEAMNFDQAEFDQLMKEAANMDSVVAGHKVTCRGVIPVCRMQK